MTVPKYLTILTAFCVCAAYARNVGVLMQGGTVMTSDIIYRTACEWPVLPFAFGVLYGATVIDWLREYPWVVLVATFLLSHLLYPL